MSSCLWSLLDAMWVNLKFFQNFLFILEIWAQHTPFCVSFISFCYFPRTEGILYFYTCQAWSSSWATSSLNRLDWATGSTSPFLPLFPAYPLLFHSRNIPVMPTMRLAVSGRLPLLRLRRRECNDHTRGNARHAWFLEPPTGGAGTNERSCRCFPAAFLFATDADDRNAVNQA